jgi:hypothetical protein
MTRFVAAFPGNLSVIIAHHACRNRIS